MSLKIEALLPAPGDRVAELHGNLVDAGQALADNEYETFLLCITGDDGAMTAGCKGEIAFRHLHVSELWVSAEHRGSGIGSKLLAKAEKLAAEKGCTCIHLETRSEAARGLYEKLGYEVFGQLADYDREVPFYYLKKDLERASNGHGAAR